jgi:hypothetical protein
MRRPTPGFIVLVVVMAGLVVWAALAFAASWRLAGDTRMSAHGWIAMTIAAVVSGLLAGALIWLAFYSARKGFDDDQTP